LNLDELIRTSGDSSLISLGFDGKEVSVVFVHGELERHVELRFESHLIYCDLISEAKGKTFFISVGNLSENLCSEKGVFVPSGEFVDFMREAKEGLHLAYGLRVSQYGVALSLIGDFRFVAILRDVSTVRFGILGET